MQVEISKGKLLDQENIKASWSLSFFVAYEYRQEKTPFVANTAEWLRLACNIEAVGIVPDRFDDGLAWCGMAWERASGEAEALAKSATALTRFLTVWGAFESVGDLLGLRSERPNESIAGSVRKHLRSKPVLFLDEQEKIRCLYNEIVEISQFRQELEHYGVKDLSHDTDSINLGDAAYYVSKIRNHLAHGTLRIGVYENWNGEYECKTNDKVIIYATRVLLMAIAKFLFLRIDDDYALDEIYGEEAVRISASEYLKNILE